MTETGQDFRHDKGTDLQLAVTLAGVDARTWTLAVHCVHTASQVALVPIITPAIIVTYSAPDSVVSIPIAAGLTENAAVGAYAWALRRVDVGSRALLSEGTMLLGDAPG